MDTADAVFLMMIRGNRRCVKDHGPVSSLGFAHTVGTMPEEEPWSTSWSSVAAWRGLTAAARAASEGASVAVVECADELGGSARYAGYLWTAPSEEALAEVDPHGDPALRRALVAGFADAVEWIRSLGVPVGDEVVILRYGRGRHIDTAAYVRACQKLITSSGGEILVGASVEKLIGERDGDRRRSPHAGPDPSASRGAVDRARDGWLPGRSRPDRTADPPQRAIDATAVQPGEHGCGSPVGDGGGGRLRTP